MPMIACHECGKKISDYADACPKCGAKPKMPELRGDWMQYRCKSCDVLIKQKVDKCPTCDADQTGENWSQTIFWGILLFIALWLARQIF